MATPVISHEATQPRPQLIKPSKNDDEACPDCGRPMARRAKKCRDCRFPRFEIPPPCDPLVRHIPLTLGQYAIVDFDVYEWIMQWRWCAHRAKNGKYYALRVAWINKKRVVIQMHRFIMGVTDPAIQVDHKEPSETLDNRRSNLRPATHAQNQANKRSFGNMSGFKGVSRVKNRNNKNLVEGWRGEITVNGKKYASPTYRTTEEAARAYDRLALKYFGEFAYTNFPREDYE